MPLTINGTRKISKPTARMVESAISNLKAEDFAILDLPDSDENYMQTLLNEDGTYTLEYREGSADSHFEAADTITDPQEIIRDFQSFLSGSNDWRTNRLWSKLDLSNSAVEAADDDEELDETAN